MKYEHKELIHDYLNVANRITRIEQRMRRGEVEFNSQTFCGVTEFNSLGLRHKGFKVDSRVAGYIDLMNTYERNIAINKRKLDYFNRFLKTLDPHTVHSLKRRYKHTYNFEDIQELGHDRIVLDEILEIEQAISFEFRTDLSDEFKHEVIQVEFTKFSEDTVEDSFQTMQKLLGV